MDKVNNTIKIHVQIITFLIIWAIVLLISGNLSSFDLWKAIKQVPTAISIYAILGLIFINWIWKLKFLQGWLIKLPNLQGTWQGELKSDWKNEIGENLKPIPVILVIRQTFNSIRCTMMTAESSSYSMTADINFMPGSTDIYLSYTYTNRPKATIRDRSEIHDGAAILKVIKNPKALEGEYWTSRKTRGEINLSFKSKVLEEKF